MKDTYSIIFMSITIADRVVVLDGGEIQQIATPQQLLENPGSPLVAGFIADATIVQAAQGWGAWPACTSKLGLR